MTRIFDTTHECWCWLPDSPVVTPEYVHRHFAEGCAVVSNIYCFAFFRGRKAIEAKTAERVKP